MSDQDIFTSAQTDTEENKQPETPATTENPFEDKLKRIVNENGEQKYKTLDVALDALAESQNFIKQLKDEKHQVEEQLTESRSKLEQMGNIEDFVNRVAPPSQPEKKQETPASVEGLNEDGIKRLLEQELAQREAAATREKNLSQVVNSLKQEYGDEASSVIQRRATELGTTPEELQDLASRNPKMALTVLGASDRKVADTPTRPSTMSSGVRTTDTLERPRVEPGKGAARGGLTQNELKEMFRKSKEFTNKRLNI